ncbi:hypothetical protein [Gelidibacter algens]|nr:hypothetical protein [Gelidibacter algens]
MANQTLVLRIKFGGENRHLGRRQNFGNNLMNSVTKQKTSRPMKKYLSMKNLVIVLILISICSCKQQNKERNNSEIEFELVGVQKWFNAWKLTANDILKIQPHEPPLMLFFDDEYVYTNSNEPPKNSIEINGPKFFGKELNWTKFKHNDSLTLPTNQRVPIGLMSFTAPISNGSEKAFFVMGVPLFWKNAKVTSKELGDENLYTSVFLHEFAHTQQNKIFGVKLDQFDRDNKFKLELSDDMIQEDFEKDSIYTKKIKAEINMFYDAFHANNILETKQLATKGLEMYNRRQKEYFVNDRAIYNTLDDFFLTMEGIGQYTTVAWLTHPKGGNLDIQKAVKGMRRGGKWWSQDEGLAMFLIYAKISNPELGKEMFGSDLNMINQLLEKQLK